MELNLVEAQISEKEIAKNTLTEEQPATGRLRFSYTLPSGRKVTSAWIQASDKTKGALQFFAQIHAEILQDQQSATDEARKAMRKERLAVVTSSGQSGGITAGDISLTPQMKKLEKDMEQSAEEYAKQRLVEATARVIHASFEHDQAQLEQSRWEKIVGSFEKDREQHEEKAPST